jgi:osmotically-inducible protein OsmY
MEMMTKSLETRLHNELATNPHLSRRNLQVETEAGRVVVRGTVGSYYHKQMVQEEVRRIDGVDEVDNRIEVHWG